MVKQSKHGIESAVREMASRIADELSLELVDVEFRKEREGHRLLVTIDKPGGVGLDDCQRLSEALSDRLDEADPIPGAYLLEVSSPGLERPLKRLEDFVRFSGRRVKIKTFAPIEGRKTWQGALLGVEGENVLVDVGGRTASLPYSMISGAHLVVEF